MIRATLGEALGMDAWQRDEVAAVFERAPGGELVAYRTDGAGGVLFSTSRRPDAVARLTRFDFAMMPLAAVLVPIGKIAEALAGPGLPPERIPDHPRIDAHQVVVGAVRTAVTTIYRETMSKPGMVTIEVNPDLWNAVAADSRLRITRVPGNAAAYIIDDAGHPIELVKVEPRW